MSDNKDLTQFERSLFERLSDAGQPVETLTIQYRMHSIIRKFPSDNFYEGRLQDAPAVTQREQLPDFKDFELLSRHFSRIVFYDLEYTKESTDDKSKSNIEEAKFTFCLIQSFIELCGYSDDGLSQFKEKIGLITPYKGQLRKLTSQFDQQKKALKCVSSDITINTVDGF